MQRACLHWESGKLCSFMKIRIVWLQISSSSCSVAVQLYSTFLPIVKKVDERGLRKCSFDPNDVKKRHLNLIGDGEALLMFYLLQCLNLTLKPVITSLVTVHYCKAKL